MEGLLNWLVQGGIIGVAACLALRVLPRSRAHARYVLACAACLFVAVLPAFPLVLPSSALPVDELTGTLGPVMSVPADWWGAAAMVAVLWLVWIAASALRIGVAAVALRSARANIRACPDDLADRLPCWSRLSRTGRSAPLVFSDRVRTAAVLGGGSPLIAIAPALVERLSDADLDRVVVHEWAHVQRRDDIAQLAQVLVRLVAGWHPAIWWLERQVEFEREVACDEIAVAMTGSAKGYASCLAGLAAIPFERRSLPVLAALSSSGLRRRLARILAAQRAAPSRPWNAPAITAALAALALAVGHLRFVESAAAALGLPARPQAPVIGTTPGALSAPADWSGRAADLLSVSSARRETARGAGSRRIATGGNTPAAVAKPIAETVSPPPAAMAVSPLAPLERSNNPLALARVLPPESSEATAEQVAETVPAPRPETEARSRGPWTAVADAGVAIGRGSLTAGTATSGFFGRLGRTIARSF